MANAKYPPLGRSFVLAYASSDRNFPILAIRKDPRVENYRIPEDLSPHPDKVRYPNHVFTGAQPTNSDEQVQWIYEILPSPWVPFNRYDDDLGSVTGRKRSVKNEGQKATLSASARTSYEARDGSATVLTETEESWATVDEDGNSLFPVKCRDLYDPSRGAVEECRQLMVPDGTEEGTLVNENNVITQTTYEAYNQYLSAKVVQTYKVSGPQLVGFATNDSGQLVTVTAQRKGSDGYAPTQPTAVKQVEVSREDAESLVERITEAPRVFDQKSVEVQKPDPIPSKFRADKASTIQTSLALASDDVSNPLTLSDEEYAKSEQRASEHVKKVTVTTKDNSSFPVLHGVDYEESFNIQIPYVESIATTLPSSGTFEADPLGDGRWLVRTYNPDDIDSALSSVMVTYPTRHSMDLPPVLQEITLAWDSSEGAGTQWQDNQLYVYGGMNSLVQDDSGSNTAQLSATPQFDIIMKDIWARNLIATSHVFFLKGPVAEVDIMSKLGASMWPVFKPKSYALTTKGVSVSCSVSGSIKRAFSPYDGYLGAVEYNWSKNFNKDRSIKNITLSIPQCIHGPISVNDSKTVTASPSVNIKFPQTPPLNIDSGTQVVGLEVLVNFTETVTETAEVDFYLPPTEPTAVPSSGLYIVDSNVEFYKFGYFIVRATTIDASQLA